MIIKWLTGLIRNKKKKEKVKVEIEELKKAILEDPKFRDEILRELEYRTGRRDVLKAGVLGLLGLSLGLGGSYAYSTVDTNTVREVVSDYAGVKIPKPCTCIVAQDGTGDYDVSPNEDASEVIQKAIDEAHSKGGGEVRIREGKYLVEKTIKIGQKIHFSGVSQTTKLIGNANEILEVKTHHGNPNLFAIISNLSIEGNGENIGIKVVDSYGTIIDNVSIRNINTGILITDEKGWSEGTRIRNVSIGQIKRYGILLKKGSGTGSFQGTIFDSVAMNLRHEYTKGIAIEGGGGGNITFIDTQIWIHADHVVGLYINGICHAMYGNIRIESFVRYPKEVYAIFLDKNANLWGSLVNLNATGPNPGTFTEVIRDLSNSRQYIIIRGENWYTNSSNAWQLRLHATKAKKVLNIGWYEDRKTFEVSTYDAETHKWEPDEYPLTFLCPTKFRKSIIIPTKPPANPSVGAMYFDVNSKKLCIYDGSNWRYVTLEK